jgi:hypothetical protein
MIHAKSYDDYADLEEIQSHSVLFSSFNAGLPYINASNRALSFNNSYDDRRQMIKAPLNALRETP